MLKVAFVGDRKKIKSVYGNEIPPVLAKKFDLVPGVIESADAESLREVEVFLSTWGIPTFTDAQLDSLPNLKLVVYAAGDVRYFATPFVKRGIPIVSTWRANAVAVAEFTLAHILLAGKSYLRNFTDYRESANSPTSRRGPGNRGETVAILGAGATGRKLIEFLRSFEWNVIVYDPFLDKADAKKLGVQQVSLEDAFKRSLVVTNHLADNQSTQGLITGDLLRSMQAGATLINAGRGRTIDQDAFLQVFSERGDLTAILDVTDPEPLAVDSPLWSLSNVFVSTHIAGSLGNELSRMAELAIEELHRFANGEPLVHLVPAGSLEA